MARLLGSAILTAFVLMAACGAGKAGAGPTQGAGPIEQFLKEQQLEGKVVLVEFGTVGCELSGKGLEAMADMAQRQAVPGLAFARLEPLDDDKAFDEYYKARALPFPVVRDRKMVLAQALGTTVYPQFVLLDKFGRVRFRGSLPAEQSLREWAGVLAAEEKDQGPNAPMFGKAELDAAALLSVTRLPDLAGTAKPLTEYQGKSGLLLAFVDTRCPFSSVAIRELPRVAASLAGHGVASLLVNIGEAEAAVKKTYAPGAAVVYDTSRQTQNCWNVQSVPTLVLLDAAGAVAYKGGAVWADVARAGEKMLSLAAGSITLQAQSTAQG